MTTSATEDHPTLDKDTPYSIEAVMKADLGMLLVNMLEQLRRLDQDVAALRRLVEGIERRRHDRRRP